MKAYVLNIAERCENMTTISLRMDDEMKKELDEMCEAMGMNISTFYMVYTKKALRERKIPFEIEAPQDPFYSKTNLEHIRESGYYYRRKSGCNLFGEWRLQTSVDCNKL